MKRLACLTALAAVALALAAAAPAFAQDKAQPHRDSRLGKPLDYNGYFPWTPPQDLKEWQHRRDFVKAQLLISQGLWPMPKKTPLKAVVHSPVKRDGYTVEKVYFASYPGHYVTGNLYRPTDVKKGAKVPGVLCPHGHWANGRFYEAGKAAAEREVKSGAEKTGEGATYPLQARCATLARLGCVVFHYDMVGYADSQQIPHRQGFLDPDAELWLQSFMGLQTWNSVRALDFLVGLPEVDKSRIGVTGSSGGGTQTFILAGVDDRVTAAFPAVMVSTAMQGGCICENCSYLRLNTGNIELAGLFAPKPLAMSAADDWTREIETKGLPELKALYKLYGAEDNVAAKAWVEFKHNYNQVAREMMYNWFNKHLKLGHAEPVVERPFVPIPPKELSVFDAEHPLPKDAKTAQQLRDYLTAESRRQLQELYPGDAKQLKKFRKVIGTALAVMMNDQLPAADDVEAVAEGKGVTYLSRKGKGEAVPVRFHKGKKFDGTAVVLVQPAGAKDEQVRPFLDKGVAVLTVHPLLTGGEGGSLTMAGSPVPKVSYAGYTWGYNRTLLANRVHDILTAVAYARSRPGVKTVHLVGTGEAGPWVVLARALCGDAVGRTAADLDRFRFEEILSMTDPMMQPGALKYGGLSALTALCAPHELFVHNTAGVDPLGWIQSAYAAAGQPDRLNQQAERAPLDAVLAWLLR